LVELLVALALAVVITALILAAFTTVQTVRRGQADRAACRDITSRLLQQVANDLERTFVFPQDTNTLFKLGRGAATSNAVLELAFARVAAIPGADDLRWAEAARLTYRLEEADRSNRTLYVLSQPLAGPGALQPPTTNHCFQGLENFDVLLFDGEKWKDDWSGTDNPTNAAPHAARLTATARCGTARHTATTEVIIPISLRFEPPQQKKSKTIHDLR
jgi:type II secretory pathway component PulJ